MVEVSQAGSLEGRMVYIQDKEQGDGVCAHPGTEYIQDQ